MKPNNATGMSGAGQSDRDASSLSAQLTDVPGDLEQTAPVQDLGAQYVEPPRRKRPGLSRAISISILSVGVLAAVLLALHEVQVNKKQTALDANQTGSSARIKSQVIPLNDLGLQPLSALSQTNALTINGNVDVAGSILLSPTSPPPAGAVAGQLYFDMQKNQVGYYNGSSYVYLQGGSASVTNNVTKVSNVTNNITNQYITTGITAINGTAGSLAMFDGIGGLTESLLSQSGNNLNTGTGVEHVTIGSVNGASNTVVQGGTGNVAINTGAETGNSGSITIQTGNSSTTAAGNVSIDTGESIITGTQIANKTFEDGIDNMGNATFGDNTTVTQSNAQAHGGTHSLAVSVGSGFFPSWSIADGGSNPPLIIPATAGHTYAFSAWVRAGTNSDLINASAIWSSDGYLGGGEVGQQSFGSVTDVSTGWKQVAGILTAPVGTNTVGFYFNSSDAQTIGEVHYFDDLVVTDLSSSSSMAALNLGATNAQIITIGNSGMLAPTTIYGGGVNVNGGTGFVNISGANLTETAGGATYSTTSGALDITAASSSTWKVGGSAGTGNNLTIQAGNAGGNANGGNLILQSGSGAGTGSGGSVIVRPQSDSTNAFEIQNASDTTTLFNADTADSLISMGKGAGSSFGNSSSGTAASSAIPSGRLNAFKFTATSSGTLTSMTVDLSVDQDPSDLYQMAIYSDNSGTPGAYMGSTNIGTLTGPGWNSLPLSAPVAITAGTTYWLVYWGNGSSNAFSISSNPSAASYYSSSTWQSGPDNGMPATYPAGTIDNSGTQHSIFATYTSSLPALTINSTGLLTQSGAAIFQDPTNNSVAFRIQNSSGAALFTADTAGMTITVSGSLSVSGNLTIGKHVITSGSKPTITAGAGACTSPTVSISGNDTAGTITVNTGTGCTGGGILATVTFANAFGSAPTVELTPGSPISQTLGAYVDDSTVSTTSFNLGTNATPMNSQTFKWNYLVVQ